MASKRITQIGAALTMLYLIAMGMYARACWSDLLSLKPNEFADFLAGAFGPLAFFWLICGYLQQGIELRQNTEALKLQATELQHSTRALDLQVEELRRSVEQQSLLAESTQRQVTLEIERNQQLVDREKMLNSPDLVISNYVKYVEGAPAIGEVTVLNAGAAITIIGIQSNGIGDRMPEGLTELASGAAMEFLPWREGEDRVEVAITIKYRTTNGTRGEYVLSLARDGEQAFSPPTLRLK